MRRQREDTKKTREETKKTKKEKKITKKMRKNQAYMGGEGHGGKIMGFSPPLLLLFACSKR